MDPQQFKKEKKIYRVLSPETKLPSELRLNNWNPTPSFWNGLVSNKEFNRFFSPKTV